MNPVIAAAMAACLQHMTGGTYDRDFQDCDRITIEYNQEAVTLTATPAAMPAYSEAHSRQRDIDIVRNAAATLMNSQSKSGVGRSGAACAKSKDTISPANGGNSRCSAMRSPLVLTSDWPLASGQKKMASRAWMHPLQSRQPQKASQPNAAATRRRKRALAASMAGSNGKSCVTGTILPRRPQAIQVRRARRHHRDLPCATTTRSRAGVGRAQGLAALQFAPWLAARANHRGDAGCPLRWRKIAAVAEARILHGRWHRITQCAFRRILAIAVAAPQNNEGRGKCRKNMGSHRGPSAIAVPRHLIGAVLVNGIGCRHGHGKGRKQAKDRHERYRDPGSSHVVLLTEEWNVLTSHSGGARVLLKARKVMTRVSGRDASKRKVGKFGDELSPRTCHRQKMRRESARREPGGISQPGHHQASLPGDLSRRGCRV